MLWEHWQLTRVEAAQRLGLGLVAGSAALVLFDDAGATIAFWILIALHGFFYFSIAKLNGGRFMDGYKPGFPLYLLYTRPVSTIAIVGVGMTYDAISCAALYVVSAAVLGFAFDQPLPLLSGAVCLVAYHLVSLCVQWSTRNKVAQWIGSIVVFLPFFALIKDRATSTLRIDLSPAEIALMVSVGVISFGLTIFGVARQRRGDAIASMPRAARSSGYPNWLVALFRIPCPTASAMRAQLWFELRSSGLPVLAIGFGLAMLIALLFAVSIAIVPARIVAFSTAVLSVPIVLLFLGGNAFGIRRRQGRLYASSFEATQPLGTAQLASIKILVRLGCLLVALIAISVSAWTSSSLMYGWDIWVDGRQEPILGLLTMRRKIGEAFWGHAGYAHVARAFVVTVVVAVLVVSLAAREAIRARYPRALIVLGAVLLASCLAIILLLLARRSGIASASLVEAVLQGARWIAAAAIVLATVYFFWSGLAERALTVRYVCGVLAISAAFWVAWALKPSGLKLSDIPAATAASISSLLLLPLMASALAPWSLSRIRHS
jgi:hypothetical protein